MGVNCTVNLQCEGYAIEQVAEFRYLGLMLRAHSTAPVAMLEARIAAAKKSFYAL